MFLLTKIFVIDKIINGRGWSWPTANENIYKINCNSIIKTKEKGENSKWQIYKMQKLI